MLCPILISALQQTLNNHATIMKLSYACTKTELCCCRKSTIGINVCKVVMPETSQHPSLRIIREIKGTKIEGDFLSNSSYHPGTVAG